MFQHIEKDNKYEDWLKDAHNLDPPFDYFSFADYCKAGLGTTNVIFKSLLSNHFNKTKNNDALTMLKNFNVILKYIYTCYKTIF